MMWLETCDGMVRADHVVRIVSNENGSVLILRDATRVESPRRYYVNAKGELHVAEPVDDDSEIPF